MNEEYINRTKEAVNFLTHIYKEDMNSVAFILPKQVDGNTETLIDLLYVLKLYIEEMIEDLKKI